MHRKKVGTNKEWVDGLDDDRKRVPHRREPPYPPV